MAIKDNILSSDPLSDEAIQMLITYREEDLLVDYKQSFDVKNNKQWLELTKDVMAFANTHGGYLVLGVQHKPFVITGLEDAIVEFLAETNNILQKVNRYVSPEFTDIRTKKHHTDYGDIVVIYIPESQGRTHMVVKEASFKYPDGKTEMVLRPGMIYVRRSATNHVITPNDLEFILARRLDYHKDSLFNKITRVMQAPIEHELVFLDANAASKEAKKVRISDDPDATPIKGISIAVPPKTDQEEIAAWIAMRARDGGFTPSNERLWYIYSKRLTLKALLTDDQIAEIIRFNLLNEIPIFYWMQFVDNEKVKNIISECFQSVAEFNKKINILHYGAAMGKTFYRALLKKMGKGVDRLSPHSIKYPNEGDLSSLFHPSYIRVSGKVAKSKEMPTESLEDRLNYLVSKFLTSSGDSSERWEIEAIDCHLYSPKKK